MTLMIGENHIMLISWLFSLEFTDIHSFLFCNNFSELKCLTDIEGVDANG